MIVNLLDKNTVHLSGFLSIVLTANQFSTLRSPLRCPSNSLRFLTRWRQSVEVKSLSFLMTKTAINEGDFICAAELATPENINLILSGRGDFCMPILPEAAKRLQITPLVEKNTSNLATAFLTSPGSPKCTHWHHGRRTRRLCKSDRRSG